MNCEQIIARLRDLDLDGLGEVYGDAILDIGVPQWRFRLQGPDASRAMFRDELGPVIDSARVTGWRVTPTNDGVVIELRVHFEQDGDERLWREVHIFRTDGEAITEHVNCTGIWSAATSARQAVDAPMVRP